MSAAEGVVGDIVGVLVTVVEACGAAVIAVGAGWAFVRFLVTAARTRRTEAFVPIRLTLGRFLALGLELQLAGDVLRTAVAPSFHEIGQLAAVAAIRTALNFFLAREIREERAQVDADRATGGGMPGNPRSTRRPVDDARPDTADRPTMGGEDLGSPS